MRIRGKSLELFALMTLFAACAALFLLLVGHDALKDQHPFQFFADSSTYHQIYAGALSSFDGTLVGVASNYLGPLFVLELLRGDIYLIMLLNNGIFVVSVLRIAGLLRLDPLKLAAVLLLSPLTVSSLLAVNKEIFTLPFIALALTGYMRRSMLAAVLALAVSILVRWQLTGFFIVMLVMAGLVPIARRGTLLMVLLLGASAFYTLMQDFLVPVLAYSEASIENYDEGGSGLFEITLDYQKRGLYFLVFPLKAAHLLFAMGLKFDKLFNPVNFYNDIFVALHCSVTFIVFLMLLYRHLFTIRADLIFATLIFLAVFCLSPVFAPRYLYGVYVIWVLVLVGAPSTLPRSQQRGRLRRTRTTSLDAPHGTR